MINHNGETNVKRSKVGGATLVNSVAKDGKEEHKRQDQLNEKPLEGGDGGVKVVCAKVLVKLVWNAGSQQRSAKHGAKGLNSHVQDPTHNRHVPGQDHGERDSRVDVAAREVSNGRDKHGDGEAVGERDRSQGIWARARLVVISGDVGLLGQHRKVWGGVVRKQALCDNRARAKRQSCVRVS